VANGRIVGRGVGVGWGVKVGGRVAVGWMGWMGWLVGWAVLVGGRVMVRSLGVGVAIWETAVAAAVGRTVAVVGRQPLSSQTAVASQNQIA